VNIQSAPPVALRVNESVERLLTDPIPGASLPPQGSDGQGGDGIICSHLRVVKDVLSRR